MSLRPIALLALFALSACAINPQDASPAQLWLDDLTEAEVDRTMEVLLAYRVDTDASPAEMRREHEALQEGLVDALGVERAGEFPGFTDAERQALIARHTASPAGRTMTCDHGHDHEAIREPQTDGPPPPYVTYGTTRSDLNVSWCINRTTGDLPASVQKAEIERALEEWAAYSPVRLTYQSSCSLPDVPLGFYTGSHGDSSAFDDAGTDTDGDGFLDENVLAHATHPGMVASHVHFDDYEDWSANPGDLWHVSAHEFGHWLGLDHSDGDESGTVTDDESNAIMSTYTLGLLSELGADDIAGIQSLYPPDACDYGYARSQVVRTYVGLAELQALLAEAEDSNASTVATWYSAADTISSTLEADARTMAIEGSGSATATVVYVTATTTNGSLASGRTASSSTTVSSAARIWLNGADAAASSAIVHGDILRTDATLCP